MVKINSHEVTTWMLGAALSLAIAWAGAARCAAKTYPGDPNPPPPTLGQSFSSGMSKLGDSLTPKPSVTPADDPLSLKSPGKPGVELYLAWALVRGERQTGRGRRRISEGDEGRAAGPVRAAGLRHIEGQAGPE